MNMNEFRHQRLVRWRKMTRAPGRAVCVYVLRSSGGAGVPSGHTIGESS